MHILIYKRERKTPWMRNIYTTICFPARTPPGDENIVVEHMHLVEYCVEIRFKKIVFFMAKT